MTKIQGDWITRAETQKVMRALVAEGAQAYFVGGCVRNALFDVLVNDIDIATDALPEQVVELVTAAGLKAIPTGIEHGTVTVVSGGVPHEVTTFRKDVETDGRRAVVSFSSDIADDARRRDFTMNALYASADGTILDPLGGLGDLQNRRVRFIEDASARIQEDYLRSLRFFRFYAWYGHPEQGVDPEGLAAIAANLDGLDRLSQERVGGEVKKLLAAPDPAPAVATMANSGVLMHILPGADNAALAPLVHLESDLAPDPIRRLAVLGGQDVADRLRLSRAEARKYSVFRAGISSAAPAKLLGYHHGAQTAVEIELLRAASLGAQPEPDFHAQAKLGAAQSFPVSAGDLMPGFQGLELGKKLKQLEGVWIGSDFSLTKAQLLSSLNDN